MPHFKSHSSAASFFCMRLNTNPTDFTLLSTIFQCIPSFFVCFFFPPVSHWFLFTFIQLENQKRTLLFCGKECRLQIIHAFSGIMAAFSYHVKINGNCLQGRKTQTIPPQHALENVKYMKWIAERLQHTRTLMWSV